MDNKALLEKFENYLLTERRVAHNTFEAYQRDLEQLAYFLNE
jgi:site-specific recombinase XerD